jgi:hypothetical protein
VLVTLIQNNNNNNKIKNKTHQKSMEFPLNIQSKTLLEVKILGSKTITLGDEVEKGIWTWRILADT